MNRQFHLKQSINNLLRHPRPRPRRRNETVAAASSTPAVAITHHFLSTTTTTTTPNKNNQPPKRKPPRINLQETLASSTTNKPPPNAANQPFVTHRLSPGQPNPLHQIFKQRSIPSDPIYRPPWRHSSKANIISAEDYANRPRVTFEEQFDSLHDGMIVLSWLSHKQRHDIFNAYTEMMLDQERRYGEKTSHEYVLRVIGERFNISTVRVSAIVDEIHEEEQLAKHNPELVHDKVAEYVDAKIQEHINNCYNAYGEVNPNEFIEDPVESGDVRSTNPTGEVVAVEDLYDVDELSRQAILREKDEAQLEIDGHVYKEDIDDDTIPSKVNQECMSLITAQNEAYQNMLDDWGRDKDSEMEYSLPLNGKITSEDEDGNTIEKEVTRRPRWKFVAQTINIREQKLQKEKGMSKKTKKRQKDDFKNTLVEQDGHLRVATMKEVNDVAWKDVRDVNEFSTRGVRSAWLKRKNGERGGWGRVPEEVKAAARKRLEEKEKSEEKEDHDDSANDQEQDISNDDEDNDENKS